MEILLGVGLALLVAVIGLVIWLSRSRTAQVEAETESKALRKARERRRVADQIMAEPTAFEPAWLRAARERVRDRKR